MEGTLVILVIVGVVVAIGFVLTALYFLGRLIEVEVPSPYLLKRGIRPGTSIRCPYCGTIVAGNARSCSNCERSLVEIVAPTRAYRPGFEEKGEVLVCIRCGRLNNPNRTECKSCHTPLEKPALPRADQR